MAKDVNKNKKLFDVLLSDEITHVHAHDDAQSHIRTPDGKEHYGLKGVVEAAQEVQPVYQECAEMRSLRENQNRFDLSSLSRRGMMGAMALGAGAMLAISSEPRYAFAAGNNASDNIIVAIFLRGGADGLSMVVPMGSADQSRYQKMRPGLKLTNDVLLPMPGNKFGLNPALKNMQALAKKNQMTVIHSTGHPNPSRSHFEKQMFIETGGKAASMSSGWLGRYLVSSGNENVFRGLTMGNQSAFLLAMDNGTYTPTMNDLGSFSLKADNDNVQKQIIDDLKLMYGKTGLKSEAAINSTINSALTAKTLASSTSSVNYPNTTLSKRLKGVAQVIKANKGLEVACVDDETWDMHTDMGVPGRGWVNSSLTNLDQSLHAFWQDLGATYQKKVTVITLSEFGRTGSTNAHNGTDHGYGSTMFILGDGVRGGVLGNWAGLNPSALNEGDLDIINDYRDPVAQILMKKMGVKKGSTQMKQIFPDYTPKDFSLYR